MKKFIFFALSSMLISTSGTLQAQQTGSFTISLTFNGESRTLSNFVPTSYDNNTAYQLMIGLHGMGDNSNNYRNALVNGLNFEAAFPSTILICPDGGNDNSRDFYTPQGDESFIETAIQYAISHYNIDTNSIILQGFSLGGRSALRYGLDHYSRFKALLLNTPAIQGVKEGANQNSYFGYNLSNAGQFPIYITLGDTDHLYIEPVNVMVAQLVQENAKVAYKKFPGGHTVPDLQLYPYTAFFDNPYSGGLDAGIYNVIAPVRTCDGIIDAQILLQNTGNDVLTDIEISYGIGTHRDTMIWQGSLAMHESVFIQLPGYEVESNIMDDTYDFEAGIHALNQSSVDLFEDFNTASKAVHIHNTVYNLPFEEHFSSESDLTKWAFNNSGDYILPFSYYDMDEALNTFNSIFIFDNAGTREEVVSPGINISAESNAYLHFNVDYNYTEYTADVLGIDTVLADTLEVLVTTDCGATYTSVFKEGGAELSGHDAPILNPLNLQSVVLDMDESKYRGFTVDVSQFAGEENVQFKFSYISALGGYIYLDDVVVSNSMLALNSIDEGTGQLSVYPNPASDQLTVEIQSGKIDGIRIYTLSGQKVYGAEGKSDAIQTVDVSHLAPGTYLVLIRSDDRQIRQRFIVK